MKKGDGSNENFKEKKTIGKGDRTKSANKSPLDER